MRYAKGTSVSIEKSRGEIEKTLKRFGATQFAYAWKDQMAVVSFEARDLRLRFTMKLPSQKEERFTKTSARGSDRSPEAAEKLWENEARQSWRALALLVKAKLAAVDAGITSFEEEFLSHVVVPQPGGRSATAGEWLIPQLASAYDNRSLPPLLPGGSEA